MKKYSWIAALLLALSLVVVGCPEGGGGGPVDPEPGAPVKTLQLADNFQYGEGYQGVLDGILKQSINLTGNIAGKITAGDEYTIKITFTADRELEDELKLGLVDRDPGVSYWKGLSWDSAAATDTRETISKDEINAGAVTKIITFTISTTASTATDASNCLVFETNGEGEKGAAGSGVKGPVSLIFTEFVFVKGGEDQLPTGPIEPPPPVEGYTINNPEFAISPGGTHSTWNGEEAAAADGSWTFTTGGIRYLFPADTAEFKVSDYDFVEVSYTVTGLASSVVKQYTTGDDYTPLGAGNANLPAAGTFTLELRNAVGNGFAIQKWGGASAMTIKFDKLFFTKGTRHTVTLNPNEGTVTPTSTYLVEGTKVGAHLPVPTRAGYNFMGWKLGETVLGAATEVTSAFANATLIAQWAEILTAAPINVAFTDVSELEGNNVTLITDGYSFTDGANWGTAWVKFTVDFGSFTLADYDKVTFTLVGSGTDPNYKDVCLVAGDLPAGGTYIARTDYQVSVAVTNNYTSGTVNVVLEIDKTKASALTAHELEVAIYVHANNATYSVTNIVFAQND